jgi:hypothetical protein
LGWRQGARRSKLKDLSSFLSCGPRKIPVMSRRLHKAHYTRWNRIGWCRRW